MNLIRPLLVSALAAAVAFGCSGKKGGSKLAFPDSVVNDEVVATVNSDPITGADVKVLVYSTVPSGRDSLHTPSFNVEMLDRLIDRTMIFQEARAAGFSAPDTVVEDLMQRFVQNFGGEQQAEKVLQQMGVTRADFARSFSRDVVIRSYVQQRIEPSIQIEETESRAFYEGNKERFTPRDSVRVRHIIRLAGPDDTQEVSQARLELMEEIRTRALAGEDFAMLAKRYSQDASAENGGDLGYFPKGVMIRAFQDVAFALKEGEISEIVHTQFGLHLILCVDRKEATQGSYEEMRERIDAVLRKDRLNSELENHLQRSRAAAIIVRNYETGA